MPPIDAETREEIPVEHLRALVTEYGELIEFLQCIETGFYVIPITESHNIPGLLMSYWRIYKNQVDRLREARKKKH